VKVKLLAALAVALFGVSYAEAREPRSADPISTMEDDLDQATAELHAPAEYGHSGGQGCGNCCQPSCSCGPTWVWTAGVEATFLQPEFDDARADVLSPETTQFEFDFEAAPRVWLGVESCGGCGLRARYWDFCAESEFDNRTFVPSPVNGVLGTTSSADLDLSVIDLEVTKRGCCGSTEWLGSFGARHVELEYDYQGTFLDFATGVNGRAMTEDVSREFDGTGITGALEGRRPFGNGRLAFLWNLRGSVLWGDNEAVKTEVDVDANIDGTIDTDLDNETSSESEELFIGELQAGLEWRQRVRCVSADVFARAMFEAQWWRLGSNGEPLSSTDALGQGDFDLYGMAFAVGISR
jgi:hypothetical protein